MTLFPGPFYPPRLAAAPLPPLMPVDGRAIIVWLDAEKVREDKKIGDWYFGQPVFVHAYEDYVRTLDEVLIFPLEFVYAWNFVPEKIHFVEG